MDWYVVDKSYVEYLSKFDYKVGRVEYGNRLKLHIGILLEVDGFKYYVPISSPKDKHKTMNNDLDFHKIVDPISNVLYAVVNINNMIPVPDEFITQLKYDEIQNFRSFTSEKERIDYIYLLQTEKGIIDELETTLINKANKLYKKVNENQDSSLAKRCCNFSLLQEKSLKYKK